MKEKFITNIIEDLKLVEKTLQELERDDAKLELWARRKNECKPNEVGCVAAFSVALPLLYSPESIVYKNIVSLLKAEARKLKQQLKHELDIDEIYTKKDAEI